MDNAFPFPKLLERQQNLRASLSHADIAVIRAEQQLQASREARAAAQGALEMIDATIVEIQAAQPRPNKTPSASA